MGCIASLALIALVQFQPPKLLADRPAEIVLADARGPVTSRTFGLGDGGIDTTRRQGHLVWSRNGCVTPAGIQVEVRRAGVLLRFPSGREVLVAPDGHLHLRDGSVAGPYEAGVELRLADGSAVRIRLSQAQRRRVRDVVVMNGERALQCWRRGKPARDLARTGFWGGVRLVCCGDGGDLYRAIALGPLVCLERILVPDRRQKETPPVRLVVLTDPLEKALARIPEQSRGPDERLRATVRTVAATARQSDLVLPDGASLRRVRKERLRWGLPRGYELELALEGQRAPRLSLFTGRSPRPMVEWVLGVNSAAFLNNPRAGEPGAPRWRGNGVRMDPVVPEFQVRPHLRERALVMRLLERL